MSGMRARAIFCLTFALLLIPLVGLQPVWANPESAASRFRSKDTKVLQPKPVLRKVLGLFHSAEEESPDKTRIQSFLAMPLNHLGFDIVFFDLARGLPKPSDLDGVAAAITWFEDDIPGHAAYLAWAAQAARNGLKFVIMEAVGAADGPNEVALIAPLLAEIGLDPVSHFVADTSATVVREFNPDVVARERPLASPLPLHRYIRRFDPRTASLSRSQSQQTRRLRRERPGLTVPNQTSEITAKLATPPKSVEVLLSASAPTDLDGATADAVLVATSSGGGYVASGFAINWDEQNQRLWWGIDPIAFLEKALDAGEGPRPVADVTTLAGRRIYFSHIDGDSWNTRSKVAKHNGTPAAEVVLKELIAPFPDLPVTVGLISCDVDITLKGKPGADDIARRIYALPQVEAASHSHTHPFEWRFFERYSRQAEETLVASLIDPKVKYGSLPRYAVERPFDLDQEVSGSLAVVERLSPTGKRPQLFLWSGDTRPFEAAIAATRNAGVRNMNGGDTRYDSQWPSLAYVRPIGRIIGRERQIFAAASNENTYTNEWAGPYDGFTALSETHQRTESPRRLKPMNVYYHMYSAEYDASLNAVRGHLERARAAPVIPIPASQYAAIADSFASLRLTSLGPLRWRVEQRGAIQTLRFDRADNLTLDFSSSVGAIGQTRTNGSLYVALDPAETSPIVALIDTDRPQRTKPHVIESRWQVSALRSRPCEVSARVEGFGPGDIVLAGLQPGRYWADVVYPLDSARPRKRTPGLVAGADGVLKMSLDADVRAGAGIEVRCAN